MNTYNIHQRQIKSKSSALTIKNLSAKSQAITGFTTGRGSTTLAVCILIAIPGGLYTSQR
jgi:hypothetical protein